MRQELDQYGNRVDNHDVYEDEDGVKCWNWEHTVGLLKMKLCDCGSSSITIDDTQKPICQKCGKRLIFLKRLEGDYD